MVADEIAALNLEPCQPIELDTTTVGCVHVIFRGIRGGRLYYGPLGHATRSAVAFADITSVTPLR